MWPFPFNLIQMLAWLPVWAVGQAVRPFLRKDHPWRQLKLSVRSWCIAGTKLAFEISMLFWVYIVILIYSIRIILERNQ